MLALEKVEGNSSQYIAMNEATKRMRQLTEKIEHSYDVSKCYSDAYWENVMNDGQDKETLLEMNKFLKETFQVEHDILKKNTH